MSRAIGARNQLDPNLAVRGYFADRQWTFKTGIGGVIGAAGALAFIMNSQNVLYLPVSLALYGLLNGYFLRVVRHRSADPQCDLPDWDGWMDLWISGITWIAVVFGWVVLCFGAVSSIALIAYAMVINKANRILVGEFSAFLALGLCLCVRFLLSFVLVNFAIEERVGAGFAIHKVIAQIRKNPKVFFAAWALAFWVELLSVVIPAMTVIGLFLIPSTWFAGQVISSTILAQAWRSSEKPAGTVSNPNSTDIG